MSSENLLDIKVMQACLSARDANEAISLTADILFENGYVNEDFKDAILAREVEFPTGLPTDGVGVAIPHTDIEYVNKPIIAVSVLESPVSFQMMGAPEQSVEVQIIFMLALNEPHAQLEMLQTLMGIIQDSELLVSLRGVKSKQEIFDMLLASFG